MSNHEQNVERLMGALVRVLYCDKTYKVRILADLLNYYPEQLEEDLQSLELYLINKKRQD